MGMYIVRPPESPGIIGAKQSFKDECDINRILARHRAGGSTTHVNQNAGRYADVSEIGDYRSAIERVRAADKVFSGLSSDIRAVFANDTATFLDAVGDPDQVELLEELGLLPLVEADAPDAPVERVDPVDPVPAEPVEPS